MRSILAVAFAIIASPVFAQFNPQQAWADIGRKFGELIARKGFNCPEGKFASPKGKDAYGDVYQVFCGDKGKDPAKGEGDLIMFRLTFKPNKDIIVQPWVE